MGRTLIIVGTVLLLAGLAITFLGKYTSLGRLPGDIVVRRSNFTFYFPLATGLLLSIAFSVLLWLFQRR